MIDPIPKLLLDTCSIMNLSYCAPVAAIFRSRYQGTAGWTEAARAELVRQRGRRAAGSTDSALDHLGEAASIACSSRPGLDD